VPGARARPGNPVVRAIGRTALALAGWRIAGALPDLPRYVIIVAPHTSNWDFAILLAARFALGVSGAWIGKHTIFRWPVRGFLLRIGGIPVDRSQPHGVVERVVAEFAAREQMVLAIAPEGTRKLVSRWRSGYWRIARGAGVPIVPVSLDYGTRTLTLHPPFTPTGSMEDDEKTLRGCFAHVRAKHPHNYAP
jgi:1-acyl-sn-glycerol-3-phosphate acyltransferase